MASRKAHDHCSSRGKSKIHRRLHLEPLEDRRLLAVVTVNTDQDVIDFNDGFTSLREAIFATNTVSGADEIVFDLGHDGPATIFLQQGELQVTESLTLTGIGPGFLTIDAGQMSRIFNITTTTGDYVFAGMTLKGGKTGGFDPNLPVNHFNGAAIRSLTTGSLTIDNCKVYDNSTYGVQANGGGIFAEGDVIITSSTISDNAIRFSGNGGGISSGGDVSITSSSIANNSSYNEGGGVCAAGVVFVSDSTISGNSASDGSGGGIYTGGSLNILTSEVRGNSAGYVEKGGGIHAIGDILITECAITENERGGIRGNEVTAISSMILGNSGDGISAVGDVTVTESTILGNRRSGIRGGNITVASSMVSENGPFYDSWGIYGSGGVTVFNSEIHRNGGTSYFSGGGGVFAQGDIGVYQSTVSENGGQGIHGNAVTINSSTISENSAGYYEDGGGGIYASADVTVISSTISGNTAYRDGGGILAKGDVLVQNSQIYQNSAYNGDGGGIWGRGVTVSSSQICGNSSQRYGGGGIYAYGDATISSSTISENQAQGSSFGQGAGLYAYGNVTVLDSTISRNELTSTSHSIGGIGISGRGNVSVIRSAVSENFASDSIPSDASSVSSAGDVFVQDSIVAANKGNGIRGKNVTIISSEISSNYRTGVIGDTTTISSSSITGNGRKGVSGSNVVVSNSTISDNTSFLPGGGISGGIVNVYSSTISGNTVTGLSFNSIWDKGGGIYATELLTINSSIISGNTSTGSGGGIASSGGNIIVTSSTISGNTAGRGGGGIYTLIGTATVNSSTISGNAAAFDGGGILGNLVTISHSTITNNHACYATLTGGGIRARSVNYPISISGSIVAGNTASGGYPDLSPASGAVSAEYCLIGNANGLLLSGTNILIGVDPLLGPLADNGGPTLTHAQLPGSPLIDRGDPAAAPGLDEVPLFDQRGDNYGRVQNGRIDIGAFEVREPVSADHDGDGDVDGYDFLAWQRGFGMMSPNATQTDGDADHDRDVDPNDLYIWQLQYGTNSTLLSGLNTLTVESAIANQSQAIDTALYMEWLDKYPKDVTEILDKEAVIDSVFADTPTFLGLSAPTKGLRNYNIISPLQENLSKDALGETWLNDNTLEFVFDRFLLEQRDRVALQFN